MTATARNATRTAIGAALGAALAVLLALPAPAGDGTQGSAPPGSRATLYLKGQLLVATPDPTDPRFAETVIYMIAHDADSAGGLIVNKAYGEGPIARFLEPLGLDAGDSKKTVRFYYGGPVEPGAGFVLHTNDYAGPATRPVDRRLSVTTDVGLLKLIAERKGPRRSLVALGYSGWSAGQLEAEIARGDWLSAPADEDLIFDADDATKWARALKRAGQKL